MPDPPPHAGPTGIRASYGPVMRRFPAGAPVIRRESVMLCVPLVTRLAFTQVPGPEYTRSRQPTRLGWQWRR
jgi:hypothetical protein